MSIYDKSSLVLIPSGTKTSKVYSQKPTNGDGDFDFTRSTAATRVNADGNIEKETSNLQLHSNNFNAWNYSTGSSATGGQSGYDGNNDAWLLNDSGVAAPTYAIYRNFSTTGVLTMSLYAKAGTRDVVVFDITGTNSGQAEFNLTSGTLVSSSGAINTTIEAVGAAGWYRCSVTCNPSSTIYTRIGAGGAGTIYLQDVQVEYGLVARDYIETTTTALYGGITDNVPRLDYTDSSCPALLLEPQRTNIIANSEYAGTNNWGNPQRLTTIANQTTSPEGVVNATKVNETAVSGTHMFDYNFTATSGVAYTFSYFAKAAERTQCYLFGYTDGGVFSGQRAIFDLSNGTITSNVGNGIADIQPYSNGWYRVSLTLTSSATSTAGYWGIGLALNSATSYLGVASSGINMYGFQLEAGSYATSYIPTYGVSQTRALDSCSKTGVSSLIGQTEGTMFMDADFKNNAGDQTILISSSGFNDYVFIQMNSSNVLEAGIVVNAVEVARIGVGKTSGIYKCAFSYANNDFVFYVNGVKVGTDSSGSMSGFTADFINLNHNNTGYSLNNYSLFKTRLTNEELATLTTI